jgi:ATP-dependent DNA helicase RecG
MQNSSFSPEFPSLPDSDPSIATNPFPDLREDLIATVRNHARFTNPKHAWSNLEDSDFLAKAGLVQVDSSTGNWSITPAGTLLFGTDSSISDLFPDLRTLIVYRDRADGKRQEVKTPLNLVETMQALQKAVDQSFPDVDPLSDKKHASLRDQVFRTLFVYFIKKRDYFHASAAKLILNPEHLSLQFSVARPQGQALSGEMSLNSVLADFLNFLHPDTSVEIESDIFRNTMQAYSGSPPIILHGSMLKILVLKPKKAKSPLESSPLHVMEKGREIENQTKTMQGSHTKAFNASRRETAKIDWNAPKTVQGSRTAKILEYCKTPRYREEIQQHVGMNNRDHFRKEVLNPLIEKGLIRPTLPDKPNSPKQQYTTV